MPAQQNRKTGQQTHPLERRQIVAHVSLRWIDQHRAHADNVVASHQHAARVVVKTEMAQRVTGCVQRTQTNLRLAFEREDLVVFNQVIYVNICERRGSLRMSTNSYRAAEVRLENIHAADVIRM